MSCIVSSVTITINKNERNIYRKRKREKKIERKQNNCLVDLHKIKKNFKLTNRGFLSFI
jgi:hypothetical protein